MKKDRRRKSDWIEEDGNELESCVLQNDWITSLFSSP